MWGLKLIGKSSCCLLNEVEKSILKKIEIFCKNFENKIKGQKMKLQTDQEFKQRKIFDVNKKYNDDMFSTAVRGGKAFADKN